MDLDSHGDDDTYVGNKTTNERHWVRHRIGVYVFDLLVGPPVEQGFTRPGR